MNVLLWDWPVGSFTITILEVLTVAAAFFYFYMLFFSDNSDE